MRGALGYPQESVEARDIDLIHLLMTNYQQQMGY